MEVVRSRRRIWNGQFGSLLCCFSVVGLSSCWIVCDLQMGTPLAREQGAACLERFSVYLDSFLHPLSGQRWTRKPGGSIAMEYHIVCVLPGDPLSLWKVRNLVQVERG